MVAGFGGAVALLVRRRGPGWRQLTARAWRPVCGRAPLQPCHDERDAALECRRRGQALTGGAPNARPTRGVPLSRAGRATGRAAHLVARSASALQRALSLCRRRLSLLTAAFVCESNSNHARRCLKPSERRRRGRGDGNAPPSDMNLGQKGSGITARRWTNLSAVLRSRWHGLLAPWSISTRCLPGRLAEVPVGTNAPARTRASTYVQVHTTAGLAGLRAPTSRWVWLPRSIEDPIRSPAAPRRT